jgi:hypothetical protein
VSTAGVAKRPKARSIDEKKSALPLSDPRQKTSRATAENTTARTPSSATLYPA